MQYPMLFFPGLPPLHLIVSHVASMSMSATKRKGLRISPWGTPHSGAHASVSPSLVAKVRVAVVSRLRMSFRSEGGTFNRSRAMSLAQNSVRSKAWDRSRKAMWIPFAFRPRFSFRARSCIISTALIGSMMFIPYIKAYWVGASTGLFAMESISLFESTWVSSLRPVSSIVSGRAFPSWHGRLGSFGIG